MTPQELTPKNIMLDMETTSTHSNAGILSLGAVLFPYNHKDASVFYMQASLKSIEQRKFHIDPDTMEWWKKPDNAEVYSMTFSGKEPIEELLWKFADWIKQFGEDVRVWGKGPDFDNVILANAYDDLGEKVPWKFRNNRCYRTLAALYPHILPDRENDLPHHALCDAIHQAEHATKILAHIAKVEEIYEDISSGER